MRNSINFILIILFFSCSSTAPTTIREISNGARNVGNIAQNANNLANNINRVNEKKYGAKGKNTPKQQNQSSNNTPQKSGLFDIKTGKLISEEPKVVFVPKCISGDCENGFGKKQYEKEIYEGEFKNGLEDGKGKTFMNSGIYYEGNYSKGMFHGNVTRIDPDGLIFRGVYVDGHIDGFGVRTRDGLAVFAYFNKYMEQHYDRQLTMNQLKYHQDTTYARFKKCNCLVRKNFSLITMGWKDVKYDVINGYGVKVRETTQTEMTFGTIPVEGYVNNTDHNIYIRAYRKHYFSKRAVYEYIDDSFVVKPGKEVMGNFRRKPSESTFLSDYFSENYVFLGQYCGKNLANICKPVIKSK